MGGPALGSTPTGMSLRHPSPGARCVRVSDKKDSAVTQPRLILMWLRKCTGDGALLSLSSCPHPLEQCTNRVVLGIPRKRAQDRSQCRLPFTVSEGGQRINFLCRYG